MVFHVGEIGPDGMPIESFFVAEVVEEHHQPKDVYLWISSLDVEIRPSEALADSVEGSK